MFRDIRVAGRFMRGLIVTLLAIFIGRVMPGEYLARATGW
jgi:hypothetical protein